MSARSADSPILSKLIAFSLPMMLAAYWPLFGTGQSVHAVVIAVRLALLAGVAALALLWSGGAATRTEAVWGRVLGAYLCILLGSALVDAEVSRGIHNWIRVAAVYAVAIALARPLRHRATGRALAIAFGAAGCLSFLFILVIYLHYAGLSLPTYDAIREFKNAVQQASGVALNPLAFATFLFGVMSLCLVRPSWRMIAWVAAIGVLSSVFTGSRAPLALAVLGGAGVVLTNLLHDRTLALRVTACTGIILIVAAGLFGLTMLHPKVLSVLTEGRFDVWTVGIEKFLEQPWTGFGSGSWHDDLASRLPGYYEGTGGLVRLRSGGYHSEFVTLLAEGGLLCFIPAIIVFGFLFRACCRIAYDPATPRLQGQALLFTFFLFFLRAGVEVPGLFGYGEDVTDYLAAIFVAIVISRASLLERPRSRSRSHAERNPGPARIPAFAGPVVQG